MNVQTFCDGFGRWNAIVPIGPDERKRARKAIRAEIAQRHQLQKGWRCVVVLVEVDPPKGIARYREDS